MYVTRAANGLYVLGKGSASGTETPPGPGSVPFALSVAVDSVPFALSVAVDVDVDVTACDSEFTGDGVI